jgi:hypothetical protein
MTYPLGSILLVRDYHLPTITKDKFFIVLCENKNEINLLSMTTSQIYFDPALIKHGVIKNREMSVYCFEADRKIGENGFAFWKNTIVSHRNNIHCFTVEKIAGLNIEILDILMKEELANLIYSFYQSNISNKHKKMFELILSEICT